MFFEKKLRRSFETQKYINDEKFGAEDKDEDKTGEKLKLEPKDILAMIISAVIVFFPLLLIISVIMFLLTLK